MNWKNNQVSEVAKEQIWKEHVRNESQYISGRAQWSLNPFSLQKNKPLTEGINKRPVRFLTGNRARHTHTTEVPSADLLDRVNSDIADPNHMQTMDIAEINTTLERPLKTPTEKYAFPQTEAQEYGWVSKPIVPTKPEFEHKIHTSDVTRFLASLKPADQN